VIERVISLVLVYNLAHLFPLPLLLIQCVAGPLSSLTSTILTNPLDVCRTRIQVEQNRRKVIHIMRELWQEERFRIFTKGLTARLSHSCIYSLFIIFGYETVKRISLKEEYQGQVRW
jgi:solute carrier family 25 protein 44